MSRRSLPTAIAAAFVASLAGAPLFAQSAQTDSADTTAQTAPRISSLPPVMSVASRPARRDVFDRLGERQRIARLMREQRRLAIDLERYDHRVGVLERHLDSLKATHDSLERGVSRIDSLTAATRESRLRLEARLTQYETRASGGGSSH
jgi:hypothetical protein